MMVVTSEMHRVLKLDIYVFIANLSVLSILYIFTILASKTLITLNFVCRAVTLISYFYLYKLYRGGPRDRDR
jgi:hypothetical protein